MKSTTYARLALFLPYLFLLATYIYLNVLQPDTAAEITLNNLSFVWSFSALFWAIPYTILVLCLLIWSRGKSLQKIINAYLLAPFGLSIITFITYTFAYVTISLYTGDFRTGLEWFGFLLLITVLANLLVGYLFVGIALLLYILVKRIGFIKAENAQETGIERTSSSFPA